MMRQCVGASGKSVKNWFTPYPFHTDKTGIFVKMVAKRLNHLATVSRKCPFYELLEWVADDDKQRDQEHNQGDCADQEVGVATAKLDIAAGSLRIHQAFDLLLALFDLLLAFAAALAGIEGHTVGVGAGAHLLHASAHLAVVVFRLLVGRRGGREFLRLRRFSAWDRAATNRGLAILATLLAAPLLVLARACGGRRSTGGRCLLLSCRRIVRGSLLRAGLIRFDHDSLFLRGNNYSYIGLDRVGNLAEEGRDAELRLQQLAQRLHAQPF